MDTDKAVSGPRKAIIVLVSAASLSSAACTSQAAPRSDETSSSPPSTLGGADAGTTSSKASRMRITVGSKVFTATLGDNATATAFKAMLPLTVNMTELNANEKHAELPHELPRKASNPGTIHTGDLMLYGTNTLVLFYKTFSTSYSYSRIGKVDDVKGLVDALGSRNVTVTFEL
jgi:hypothetical protein